MQHYGLTHSVCCEDLARKIDMLRQASNLRSIAVKPVADVARCAEQIGTDYVFAWRPNPTDMVCCGFDEQRVRRAAETRGTRGCVGTHSGRPRASHLPRSGCRRTMATAAPQ